MAYRPSHAGFELSAGSAFAGVFPASFQAAVIGTGLTLAWIVAAEIAEGRGSALLAAKFGLAAILIAIFPIMIATLLCAFYVGLVGVPLAALLGDRLDTPLGLAIAVGAAFATGLAALAVFGVWPLFDTPDWLFALMTFAYALPAGLIYRRSVITARLLSPFARPSA